MRVHTGGGISFSSLLTREQIIEAVAAALAPKSFDWRGWTKPAERVLDALAALGLVVTSREPTRAQLKAAMKVIDGRDPLEAVGYNLMRAAYYAMLEAAPEPTQEPS